MCLSIWVCVLLPLQVEQDGGAVAMRFTLTPEVIAMVFAEKPHVKRAYMKSVPHQMSEKEFWVRYLKHELSKEVRARGRGGEAGSHTCTASWLNRGLSGCNKVKPS
jgi:hypothetical protein